MATVINDSMRTDARMTIPASGGASYEAYQILHVAFVLAPICAGLDKFFDILVDWDMYLAPQAAAILGQHAHQFMLLVGVIEVIAGLGCAAKPRYFAWIVAIWLAAIFVNLLMCGTYYDIALRDFGLFLGAIALGRLASIYDRSLTSRASVNRVDR